MHRLLPSVLAYNRAHAAVRKERGRAAEHACAHCGMPAQEWAYDNADPDEQLTETRWPIRFSTDPAHYFPLCAPCHRRFDLEARCARLIEQHGGASALQPQGDVLR